MLRFVGPDALRLSQDDCESEFVRLCRSGINKVRVPEPPANMGSLGISDHNKSGSQGAVSKSCFRACVPYERLQRRHVQSKSGFDRLFGNTPDFCIPISGPGHAVALRRSKRKHFYPTKHQFQHFSALLRHLVQKHHLVGFAKAG
jgi:hypothetical protein